MAENINHPTLSPCPFCTAAPIFDGAWARHPPADCLMGGEILFAWTVPTNVRRWNMRAALEDAVRIVPMIERAAGDELAEAVEALVAAYGHSIALKSKRPDGKPSVWPPLVAALAKWREIA